MSKLIAYRYDPADYADGQEISSWSDHLDRLTASQKDAEMAIRDGHARGHDIRSEALYAWKDRQFAEFAWGHKGGCHLYEIEIDEANVLHTGDLAHFTSVERALQEKQDPAQHIGNYWTAEPTGKSVEILATKANVRRRLKRDNERQSLHDRAAAKLRDSG